MPQVDTITYFSIIFFAVCLLFVSFNTYNKKLILILASITKFLNTSVEYVSAFTKKQSLGKLLNILKLKK